MCWSFVICRQFSRLQEANFYSALGQWWQITGRPAFKMESWPLLPWWMNTCGSADILFIVCDVKVMLREHEWTKTASPVHVRRGSVPGAWPWQELHPRWHQEIIQVGSKVSCWSLWSFWITTQLLKMRSSGVSGGKHLATQMAVCSWMFLCKQTEFNVMERTSRQNGRREEKLVIWSILDFVFWLAVSNL